MEANSSGNLVLFGLDITELQMCENCDFVVPVNIRTHSICAHPIFLGYMLPCILISELCYSDIALLMHAC